MLTLEQCRKMLDEETSKSLTDETLLRLRDEMYSFAILALEIFKTKECELNDGIKEDNPSTKK